MKRETKERNYWFLTIGRGRQSYARPSDEIRDAIKSLRKRKPNLMIAVWRMNARRDTLLYAGKAEKCTLGGKK